MDLRLKKSLCFIANRLEPLNGNSVVLNLYETGRVYSGSDYYETVDESKIELQICYVKAQRHQTVSYIILKIFCLSM